jgi:hypothetical protein
VDFRRGGAIGRTMETEVVESRLLFVEQVHESLFMLCGLRLLVRNDALRWRQTDASTRAAASFPGDVQARLLSAGHLENFH